MSGTGAHVVIIGGGVVGVTSAYYLNQRGYQVTVLDRGTVGGACSHGNCGLVTPSHVLPLAEPGVLQMGLKAMLNSNGPLRIRPGLNLSLWRWLIKFARRCNEHDMLEAAAGIHALLASSRNLYDELIDREQLQCEWQPRGVLFVFKTQARLDKYAETDRIQSKHFQESARLMTAKEVIEFEPALRDDVVGAWYYQQDAFLRPDRLMSAWREKLAARGVKFVEHCDVQSFTANGKSVGSVKTAGQEFKADIVLVCTGAWTPQLQSQIGANLPIQPGKGYSMTMTKPAIVPKVAMLLPEVRVGVTPMDTGYRLGSIMELAGYDDSLREERLSLLTNGAKQFLRDPIGQQVEEKWFGWRPMTYDSVPIIDRASRWNNVWLAVGHNMLGLSMAPATGRLVGEMIAGDNPHIDPHHYRLSRFN